MCGSSGDDGYQARQDQMKAQQDAAIQKINSVFGKGDGAPIYQTTTTPGIYASGGTGGQETENGNTGAGAGQYFAPVTTQSISGYDTATRDANAAEREKLYGTISADSEARLLDNLGDDRTKAERQVRFQLARQGLNGGSADIDQGADLLEQYQKGSLEARNASTAAANTARSGDEKTRVGLINNIRSGMGESDALSAAYAGLQNNANEARDSALGTDIGGFFNDLAILNNNVRYQQGVNGAVNKYQQPGLTTSGSSGGNNGSIQG